jgi:hypothetical protein
MLGNDIKKTQKQNEEKLIEILQELDEIKKIIPPSTFDVD